MKKFLLFAFAAVATSNAFAVNLVLNNQVLTMDDPAYDRVDETGFQDGVGSQVNYHVLDFYVTQSGTYDFEMAVREANDTRDTFLFVYAPALDPNDATLNFLGGDDDSTDSLTVLSGAYHSGSDGRSRFNAALIANTQYQAVMTSFQFDATFFQDMTYDVGIGNGLGNVIAGAPVPEPATMAILGVGALALARRRRRA